MNIVRCLSFAALPFLVSPASALTILTDFSGLGTVFQSTTGSLSGTFSADATDVTAAFQADANYAASILGRAIGVKSSLTISYSLADLSVERFVADSHVSDIYATTQRPSVAEIRVNNSGVPFFVDPTPFDQSEFSIAEKSAPLGGGLVNVSRFGVALPGSGAEDRWDLVSTLLHETEHDAGFTMLVPKFLALAGDDSSLNRSIEVPTSLSGLPSRYSVPFVTGSPHIDGSVDGGLFNDATIAYFGFLRGQRGLLTGVEASALCVVNGCTAAELNTNPYGMLAVPLPASACLFAAAILALGACSFSKMRRRAFADA